MAKLLLLLHLLHPMPGASKGSYKPGDLGYMRQSTHHTRTMNVNRVGITFRF